MIKLIYPKEGVSAKADTPSFSTIILIYKIRIAVSTPLVPLKQIPGVHLVRHVRELVAPAVGHDHVAAGLEGLQVVGYLGAEELRRVQRGLVDHHGHALCLHALHDALDGASSEVVGVGLHRQAVHAHDILNRFLRNVLQFDSYRFISLERKGTLPSKYVSTSAFSIRLYLERIELYVST